MRFRTSTTAMKDLRLLLFKWRRWSKVASTRNITGMAGSGDDDLSSAEAAEPEPILIYALRSKHIAITFSGLSVLVSKGNTSPSINITSELYHVIESA